MRKHGRVDKNQASIVKALRQAGATVTLLSAVGGGVPDLIAGFRKKNYLVEIKGDKGKLTPDQEVWHEEWKGQVAIVRTEEEGLKLIGRIK